MKLPHLFIFADTWYNNCITCNPSRLIGLLSQMWQIIPGNPPLEKQMPLRALSFLRLWYNVKDNWERIE